jgi:excisionase family DNA binding protein
METQEMDELLTTRQVQELLQVDRVTIYRMLNDGRLQGFKVGGQWRFSRQGLDRWLQEQQAVSQAAGIGRPAQGPDSSGPDLALSCMQPIQDILADALQVGAVVTGLDGQPLTTPSNPNAFCSLLLDSAARQLCLDWWRRAGRGLGAKPQFLTCHAGLRYACGRIDVQSQPVAVLFAGQFLDRGRAPGDEGRAARLAQLAEARHGTGPASPAALQQALAAVPSLDSDEQARLLRLASRVATTFAEIGEERARLMGRLRRIAEMTNL